MLRLKKALPKLSVGSAFFVAIAEYQILS